jgi:hypothetical protein
MNISKGDAVNLVLIAGNHGGNIELGSSGSATRLRACLAGAVAIVGAGLIAANPVAPAVESHVVHRDVRLASADALADLVTATDPVTEWSSVISEAITNVQQIGSEIQADPLPVLAEVIGNQIAFGDTIDTNLQSLGTGLSTLITDELPGQLQTLFSGIEAGDISTSVNNFTTGLLVDLLPGASSLVNIFDIPGEIGQNLANVLTENVPNVGLEALLAPVGILFGTTQALADSSQSIVDALDAGQTDQAFTDLLNIPAVLTGAFLNGYDATATLGIGYAGLLSTIDSSVGSGLLDEFLVQIPQEIAQSLAGSGTPATLAGDLTALLGDLAPNLATDALSGL